MSLMLSWVSLCFAASPVGFWQVHDHHTGKRQAVMQIYESVDGLKGRFVRGYPGPWQVITHCYGCPGKEGQALIALDLMEHFVAEDDSHYNVDVLHPKYKMWFSAYFDVQDDQLEITAWLGLPIFSRTQTWMRISEKQALKGCQVVPKNVYQCCAGVTPSSEYEGSVQKTVSIEDLHLDRESS